MFDLIYYSLEVFNCGPHVISRNDVRQYTKDTELISLIEFDVSL